MITSVFLNIKNFYFALLKFLILTFQILGNKKILISTPTTRTSPRTSSLNVLSLQVLSLWHVYNFIYLKREVLLPVENKSSLPLNSYNWTLITVWDTESDWEKLHIILGLISGEGEKVGKIVSDVFSFLSVKVGCMVSIKNAEVGKGRDLSKLWLFGWLIMGNVTGMCEKMCSIV